ncbi:uncharacterized protein LOC107884683 [Acyrthosiphon pisum]|uniref:Uncharacterized protein n=1 Tax=Acyrthosiphon pisum TaxID=7029 RepID=A0A8R2D6J8_ACYPI|nr:uncharacterized protein LOC107884683 [Acyrthosiphon pisum]|eukprot:XP_016662848.1 PREDICTED: uncharacterized protein LOC107884683 [Acyrthosiphon pisum]
MSEQTPLSAAYPLTLQAVDFFEKLKDESINGPRHQYVRGDRICIECFRRHVQEANRKMNMPLNPYLLNRAIIPVTAFIHAVIDNPNAERSVCIEVGEILEDVIGRWIISVDHLFEE